jgi:cytoskeletal protein CcmA (bactofilin family)
MALQSFIGCLISLFSMSVYAGHLPDGCYEKQEKLFCSGKVSTDLHYFGDAEFDDALMSGVVTILGDVSAHASTFARLKVTGDVKVDKVVWLDQVKIIGDVKGRGLQIVQPAEVIGDFIVDLAEIAAPTRLVGEVKLNNSKILAPLTLAATQATLTKVTTKAIYFMAHSGPQTLHLTQSTIEGNIHFDAGNGVVLSDRNSIIQGQVEGGKIILH